MNVLWEEDFFDYLHNERGLTKKTSRDYVGRVNKVCELDSISLDTLLEKIDEYIDKYKEGSYKDLNIKKHYAPSSALVKLKEYLEQTTTIFNKTFCTKSLKDMSDEEFETLLKEVYDLIKEVDNKCYYIMYYKKDFDGYVQETWHIDNNDPLKCLKLSYDLSKKFELENGKPSYILFADHKTRVPDFLIKIALKLFPFYTLNDYHNES